MIFLTLLAEAAFHRGIAEIEINDEAENEECDATGQHHGTLKKHKPARLPVAAGRFNCFPGPARRSASPGSTRAAQPCRHESPPLNEDSDFLSLPVPAHLRPVCRLPVRLQHHL